MKFFIGLLAAFLLVVLGTTVDAQAQTYYLGNSSAIATSATIQTSTCGTIGPILIPPGTVIPVAVPTTCTVTGIWYRTTLFFPVGYNGGLPAPNPPFNLIVTIARAVFLN